MKRSALSASAEALIAGERLFAWGSPAPMGAPARRAASRAPWALSPGLQALMAGERLRAQRARSREDAARRGKDRP